MARSFALALGVGSLLLAGLWSSHRSWADENDPFDDAPATEEAPAAEEAPDAGDDRPARKQAHEKLVLRDAARIREALADPTKMEFTKTPLQDAVDYLKDFHGIEIQIDQRHLEDQGHGTETPITGTIKGLPLSQALKLILDPLDCTYVIHGDVLMITTKDVAQHMTEVVVYDVGDLMGEDDDAHEIADVLESLMPLDPAPVQQARRKAKVVAMRTGEEEGEEEIEAIVCAAPEGPVSRVQVVPFRKLLLVRASQQDHEEVHKLLDQIRAKLK